MMTPHEILVRPVISEKNTMLNERGQYVFEVDQRANKIMVRHAVQTLFKVGVVDVNTMVMRGKEKRMGRGYAKLRNWKKAIATLKAGDEIQFFDEEKSE